MTTNELSKKEYLKKYLSGGDKKKKKKKVGNSNANKSKIIDDDIDLSNMKPLDGSELEIFDLAEEAPQVVGIVDDRPEEVRLMSEFRATKKWKVIADEHGFEDVKIKAVEDDDKKSDDERNKRSGSDPSPPRKLKKKDVSPGSPPRRKKDVDSDASPPRKSNKQNDDSDASPPRKSRKSNHDSDASPARKSKKSNHNPDSSPPRRHKKTNYDSDPSPPRKSRKVNYNSNASPPRRYRRNHDSSPPRKSHRSNHVTSGSPPRRTIKKEVPSDESPPRKSRRKNDDSDASPPRKKPDSRYTETSLSGKKTGLQNSEDMRKELSELRQKQNEAMAKMSSEVSGKDAAVVLRDRKTGRRRDLKEEARKRREKDEKEAEKLAQYAVWGKGMKQIEDRQEKMKDEQYEMSKPLARYADDKDLDEMLKNQEWEGDPMLEYIRKKKRSAPGAAPPRPEYQGEFMPNRYGIRPGYRWDGVDRSTGYEKKWFDEQNAKKAREEEAFKWSTADM